MSEFAERFFTSQDNLRLFFRDYAGPSENAGTAVLCIGGLTRNSRDFEALAPKLADTRRVLVADLRGRGKSDYAVDYSTYALPRYIGDCLDLLTAAGEHHVVIIGTSLGGIIAMGIAASRPTALAGVVLNDVGPELDPTGLARIAGYVGSGKVLESWEACAAAFKNANDVVYPKFSDDDWMMMAKRSFHYDEAAGGYVSSYDDTIAEGFKQRGNTVDLWPLFKALKNIPTLTIRGGISDILSAETLAKMQQAVPAMKTAIVPDVGHVPLLTEPEALTAIQQHLAAIDA